MSRCSVKVLIGNYGTYAVPDAILAGVKLTKKGWPDKRNPAKYNKVMGWVNEQEKAEYGKLLNE